MNCFDYEYEKDTAGMLVMRRVCYCATTACLKTDHSILKFPEDEIDPETEKRFYEKVFKSNPPPEITLSNK